MKKESKKLSISERQVISRKKKKDSGKTQVSLWLSSEIVTAIDERKGANESRSKLIEQAIKDWLDSQQIRDAHEVTNYENFGSW